MKTECSKLNRCESFIRSQLRDSPPIERRLRPFVAISRETYSDAHDFAETIRRTLQSDAVIGEREWAIFDQELVSRVLQDHNLPRMIAQYMPEDRDREFSGLINEILGLHPSLWELFHHTCDTVRNLAHMGNVILMGRGSHIMTRNLPAGFHIRVIADMTDRVCRAKEIHRVTRDEAARLIKRDDQARMAYIRSHFDEDINDPHHYDWVINTSRMNVTIVSEAVRATIRQKAFN